MDFDVASLRQREKLKSLLRERGVSLRRMSLDLNLNESYFQQFVTYGRPSFIDGQILQQTAAYLGVSEDILTPDYSGMQEPDSFTAYDTTHYRGVATRKAGDGALVLIPCYDLAQKPEGNNWRDEKNQSPPIAFSRQMLQLITHSTPEQLALLKIHSNSMEPALSRGDYALLDCSYQLAGDDGIYAISQDSQLIIKRLTIDPVRKQVTLTHDNVTYPSIREYSLIDIHVAGRVIWVSKKI